MNDVLHGYAAASAQLVARFEDISSADLFAPVSDLLPKSPVRIADIGAGTGRDAAWFARKGHQVVAVEPVKELRAAGMTLHTEQGITWLDDQLPELSAVRREPSFNLVILCAVWQHLNQDDRAIAIRHLAAITVHGGLLVMSLRHGVGAAERQVFPIAVESVIDSARRAGFEIIRAARAGSVQAGNYAAGVRWTWLALRRVD